MRTLVTVFLLLFTTLPVLSEAPKRAMVLVFDQMRAEYIDRFDLPNFKRAQRMGLNFDNGIVGHLESNTIISHPVINTGLLPGHFVWGAQVMQDNLGLLGPRGLFYMPARLSPEQWLALQMEIGGRQSIIARVKEVNPGPSFVVAQKEYAAYNFAGPFADSIICLGDVLKSGPYQGHHSVGGVNVPEYIAQPVGNRFYVEGVNKWGSDEERYSLKGSGYLTGTDPERPGGDVWVGDAVEKIMEEEPDWSTLFASFGAIDKVSHTLGEHDEPTSKAWAVEHGITLENTLRLADKELGRILTRLEREGLMEETVVVITADHGGQRNSHFRGRMERPTHRDDSYYGNGQNFDFSTHPHPSFQAMLETGKMQAVSMDTLILMWTEELSQSETQLFVTELSQMPGVAEVYARESDGSYQRRFRSDRLEGRELAWAQAHHQDLVDTMLGPGAPGFAALLFDDNGYGLLGAHGGAQEMVQRIPMIMIAPNLVRGGSRSKAWARLVDINPMVGRVMGLPPQSGLDGTSKPVEAFLK